jgi:hypothetical protein
MNIYLIIFFVKEFRKFINEWKIIFKIEILLVINIG